jgi:hypothetical protein
VPAEVDPFSLFRWLLAIVGTVYTLVCTGQALYRWFDFFGSSRGKVLLGRYTLVLLLRMRLRRFAWELCQIVLLLAALAGLIYVHRF